ncbi:hypothetical protein RhiTH_005248 [Rhizoctonia solani]|uniref:F-box domain-containing protein n=1 Tax=Rhizoctonia solani TaxID=456999 RepID=A0A8H7H4Q3_9AGAM|nr:hypothetical protein RHS04_07186 [Rhizoctonia solani]
MVPSEPLDCVDLPTGPLKPANADDACSRGKCSALKTGPKLTTIYFASTPPGPPLPPELHAIIIDYVATYEDEPNWLAVKPMIRDTLRALCMVNKYFESLAVRYLYSRVHITTQSQLAAFRKAIAYFGRPTALARYVRTFSISCTTHIASYQFSDDLLAVLHALHLNLERLLLDVRRRQHFRPTRSPNGQDTGPVILCGGTSKLVTPTSIFNMPWPKLIEVSISEGLDQYVRLSHLPQAFDNVKRLALGYTMLTEHTIRTLKSLPWLEELVLVNSSIRWSDFKQALPPDPIITLLNDSPNLRRFVWMMTPRPRWDMENSWDDQTTFDDAEHLSNVPDVEVFYWPEIQSDEETLQEGLAGPRFLGESAKYGTLWEQID